MQFFSGLQIVLLVIACLFAIGIVCLALCWIVALLADDYWSGSDD